MERFLIFLGILILSTSCAEMNTALSKMNEDNGSSCAYMQWYAEKYNSENDKYERNFKTPMAKYYEEDLWLNRRGDYLVKIYKSNIYYEKSPVTGFRYRFVVNCTRWH
jgi:hypothetical protein